LQGRCLFLASRFAELLPADTRGQYFEAAIQVIESNETEIPFKVSAVKSIQQLVQPSALRRFYVDLPRPSFTEYISDAELAVVPHIIRDLKHVPARNLGRYTIPSPRDGFCIGGSREGLVVYNEAGRSSYYGIVGCLAEEYQGFVLLYPFMSIALIH
jgi:hypothetical protein